MVEPVSATLAAASIATNLLGGILGNNSQRNTNRTNRYIADQTLSWDREKFSRQMDFERYMWMMNNEYNSPVNQVARLRAAGINPALAMSNIQPGMASSSSAPSGGAPTVSANQQPLDYSFLGRGISDAAQLFYSQQRQQAETSLINEQKEFQAIQNKTALAKFMEEINELRSKVHSNTSQGKYYDELERQLHEQSAWNFENNRADFEQKQAQINYLKSMQLQNDIQTDLLKREKELDLPVYKIGLLSAQISETLSRAMFNKSASSLNYSKIATEVLNQDSLHLSNEEKRRSLPYVEDVISTQIAKERRFGGVSFGIGLPMVGKILDVNFPFMDNNDYSKSKR